MPFGHRGSWEVLATSQCKVNSSWSLRKFMFQWGQNNPAVSALSRWVIPVLEVIIYTISGGMFVSSFPHYTSFRSGPPRMHITPCLFILYRGDTDGHNFVVNSLLSPVLSRATVSDDPLPSR